MWITADGFFTAECWTTIERGAVAKAEGGTLWEKKRKRKEEPILHRKALSNTSIATKKKEGKKANSST